jgi:hypothetical protein
MFGYWLLDIRRFRFFVPGENYGACCRRACTSITTGTCAWFSAFSLSNP